MGRKKLASIWHEFVNIEGDRPRVRCNHCQKEMVRNVTRMKHHLTRQHAAIASAAGVVLQSTEPAAKRMKALGGEALKDLSMGQITSPPPIPPAISQNLPPQPQVDRLINTPVRTENDTMGPIGIPETVDYGPETQRAITNFAISGLRMPREFLSVMCLIKAAYARENMNTNRLPPQIGGAIIKAAEHCAQQLTSADESVMAHFPVDVFQTGSGTSSNMNVNEVIARRAQQYLQNTAPAEFPPTTPGKLSIHPNDHVNMGQSSNDVVPTAVRIAIAYAMVTRLSPALENLSSQLDKKVEEYLRLKIVKPGRTHMMDALPVYLGDEFEGYSQQIRTAARRVREGSSLVNSQLPLGGTAVGTGLNGTPEVASKVCEEVCEALQGLPFTTCKGRERFGSFANADTLTLGSATLRQAALALSKVASDLRLMASGPRCGLGEIELPALQPGSSMMPGKVNPVLCESVMQVCCQVIGSDLACAAASIGGIGGMLDLYVSWPLICHNMMSSINMLARSTKLLCDRCVLGLKPNVHHCRELAGKSLQLITAIAPRIGHDQATRLANQAMNTGTPLKDIIMGTVGVVGSEKEADDLLDLDAIATCR